MVVDEPESPALREYLAERPLLASCVLARVEVIRAVKLHSSDRIADAERFLQRTNLVRLEDDLLDAAAGLASATLRTLDAIHLAAALTLRGELSALVTYDQRMARAALELSLPVAAPGRQPL